MPGDFTGTAEKSKEAAVERNKEGEKKGFLAPVLVLLTMVLFSYFLVVNFPKLEHTFDFHNRLKRVPAAVNLRILKGNKLLFKKSFARNRHGVYITNCFDISKTNLSPNSSIDGESLSFYVNGRPVSIFTIFGFRHFNAACINNFVFVFTTSTYGVKEIAELEKHSNSLLKLLTIKNIGNEAVQLYSAHETADIKIKYPTGNKLPQKVPVAIPVTFEKDRIYELAFEYMVTGSALPLIYMNSKAKEKNVKYYSYALYRSPAGRFRKASILFSPGRDTNSLNLILSSKRKQGTVIYRKISTCEYANTNPIPAYFKNTGVVYHDFYAKLEQEFIEKKSII